MKKLLVVLLILASCSKEKPELKNSLANDEIAHFSVKLNVGNGWIKWKYITDINSDGNLKIYEKCEFPEAMERSLSRKLLFSEIQSLQQDLGSLSKIKLSKYGFGPDKPFDLPVTIFTYQFGDYIDTASIYFPEENELPVELSNIITKIKEIQNKYDPKQ